MLFTSGTAGPPKMAVHSLATLTGAIKPATAPLWGTFYDIRRYGGLQILLRALLGEGSMALTDSSEPFADFLARLGRLGVTHLSGTPSHWRWMLMSAGARDLDPTYIRLSGEIADQAVLDQLRAFYSAARIGHAYASTEAGVGFEVADGLEGFPASLIETPPDGVELQVTGGTLRVRSARTASRYLGHDAEPLAGLDGFVDTGDFVERREDRYYFLGRRGGIINVGGLKVHPEEIEAVINRHPAVSVSLAKGRRNPITGAIVIADVVVAADVEDQDKARLKEEILEECRLRLATFKVPARITFVPALPMTPGGKLERAGA